jgi:hypothetical protein
LILADPLPLLAAAVTSPSSRTDGNPANAVTLAGYVEKARQTVTIQAVDQNTGALVTLGTTKAAMSGTPHTTPSGTHYTAYPWTFNAGVLALNYWAPQTIVADLATSQGHLELFASAGGQNLDTFSAAARASAQASGDDPQTAAANFSDGKSTVLFDPFCSAQTASPSSGQTACPFRFRIASASVSTGPSAATEPRWNAGRRGRPIAEGAAQAASSVARPARRVCRRSASFSFRSPDERSEIRERHKSSLIVPGYRSAHPGYKIRAVRHRCLTSLARGVRPRER